MSENVRVLKLGDHEYGVDVVEGDVETHHRIVVEDELLDDLGFVGVDEERLVRESVLFLLEKEKSTSIGDDLPLGAVVSTFPDYVDEMRVRLAS